MPLSEPHSPIEKKFRLKRGHWVILDLHLAEYLGVTTEVLLEQVSHFEPLPGELGFYVEADDGRAFRLRRHRGRPALAFTEHGVVAAAFMIGTPVAIERAMSVLQAFRRHHSAATTAPAASVPRRMHSPIFSGLE